MRARRRRCTKIPPSIDMRRAKMAITGVVRSSRGPRKLSHRELGNQDRLNRSVASFLLCAGCDFVNDIAPDAGKLGDSHPSAAHEERAFRRPSELERIHLQMGTLLIPAEPVAWTA